jgi:hypothetical protein
VATSQLATTLDRHASGWHGPAERILMG